MRDISLIVLIVLFWFFMTIVVTGIANDSVLNADATGLGNTTSSYPIISADGLNISETSLGTTTAPISYVNMLTRIFTFRIPSDGMPTTVAVFISFLNWLLVILFGLLVYRLIRHGGG